jgi:hypothetical protein
MDARYEPTQENPEFTPRFERVTWQNGSRQYWSQVFTPSDEAKAWDGAEWATAAIGVRNAVRTNDAAFTYCDLRITGRTDRIVPNTGGYSVGCYGRKAIITFNKGTEDESTFDCWVVPQQRQPTFPKFGI